MTSSENSHRRLIAARSDLELRLTCGKSISAHSQKLSLASSVLGDLIDVVMEEQITAMRAAKRKRDADGTSDSPCLCLILWYTIVSSVQYNGALCLNR